MNRSRRAAVLRSSWMTISLLAGSFAWAGAASAQFATLDRQSATTQLGAGMGIVVVDRPGPGLDTVLRIDLYGEVAFGDWGVYSALPISQTIKGDPSVTAVGNLEVGGVHRMELKGPLSLVSHAGLVFPTAGSSADKQFVAAAGSLGRIADLQVASLPDLWALRVATSPRISAGPFFGQADVGFDFLFPDGPDEIGVRTSLGGGVNIAIVTITAEIANAGLITESNSFDQTLSLGGSINAFILSPRIVYTTPLDDRAGNEYMLSFGVGFGF